MNFETVKNKLQEWLQPELETRNLFLVDIKFAMGRRIEVYIDSDEGVHIDECAAVSRFLETNLDGSGLVPDNYILEVSSPGMSNPLKIPRQYKRRIGSVLNITKTDHTVLNGKLIAIDEDKIILREMVPEKSKTQKAKEKKTEGGNRKPEETAKEWTLPFSEIKKATIQFNF